MEQKTIIIRVDDDLHARVKELADQRNMSMNGLITSLLERELDKRTVYIDLGDRAGGQPIVIELVCGDCDDAELAGSEGMADPPGAESTT